MKMKLKPILVIAQLGVLLAAAPLLPGEQLSAAANLKPIPLEQSPSTSTETTASSPARVVDSVEDMVGTVTDTLKNNHWQQQVEVKTGKVYLLRRSTDEPVKPGETVILRFRTPSEILRKQFLYSRYPRAQVENHPS